VAGLFHGLLNWRGRNGAGPDLEFAAFNDVAGNIGRHFQNDAARRRMGQQSLSPGETGRLPQFPRKHNPVGGIERNGRFHAITMAWLWLIGKFTQPFASNCLAFAIMLQVRLVNFLVWDKPVMFFGPNANAVGRLLEFK